LLRKLEGFLRSGHEARRQRPLRGAAEATHQPVQRPRLSRHHGIHRVPSTRLCRQGLFLVAVCAVHVVGVVTLDGVAPLLSNATPQTIT
jgi:hypothetical protein